MLCMILALDLLLQSGKQSRTSQRKKAEFELLALMCISIASTIAGIQMKRTSTTKHTYLPSPPRPSALITHRSSFHHEESIYLCMYWRTSSRLGQAFADPVEDGLILDVVFVVCLEFGGNPIQ